MQLIRASLATKTDTEIAELLEISVEDVREIINDITGGGAQARAQRIDDVREVITKNAKAKEEARVQKLHRQSKKRRELTEMQSIEKERESNDQRRRSEVAKQSAAQKQKTKEWEAKRSYKTRVIDYSVLKSVRVNRSTLIYVDKSIPDKQAIEQYYQNRSNACRTDFDKELNEKMK